MALEEVFYRLDLDGSGALSRSEFDFFQELVCGEICDNEAWTTIQGTCIYMYIPAHSVLPSIVLLNAWLTLEYSHSL